MLATLLEDNDPEGPLGAEPDELLEDAALDEDEDEELDDELEELPEEAEPEDDEPTTLGADVLEDDPELLLVDAAND